MPSTTEDTLVKKMFSHQSSLMNDHHSTAVVMYKCSKRQRIVVGAGVWVKERLEFLLENDDDLKRCRSQRYFDVVPAQAYTRSRANQPPNKLMFPLKYINER